MADTVAFSFETYANAWTVHDEYTFIYKHASGVDIPVDVFVPTSPEAKAACAQRGGSLPVLFWIHGGGGLQGGRTERYQHLLEAVNKTAFVGVFPDYRCVASRTRLCAGESKQKAKAGDVTDLFR